MIEWNLPITVDVDGTTLNIRNKCDYRVVLDAISALTDEEIESEQERIITALVVFYEDLSDCLNIEKAANEMLHIISAGEIEKDEKKPRLMDWEHDYMQVTPPISRVLGYEVRNPERYTHWYTFVGAFREIGECTFNNIIAIRSKRQKGKKLEAWEQEFYRNNRNIVDLPIKFSAEQLEWLNGDD